jgi:hypothetical protein
MTEAGGVIDAIGAEVARHLLGHVIHFVGDGAGRDEERESARLAGLDSARDPFERFVPGNAAEPAVSRLTEERIRDAAQFAELRVVHCGQQRDVSDLAQIEGGHGV